MKIKSINNKRGSHVGVVVSFVVFVTFLVYLYLLLQPTTVHERDRQYILDYLKLNLLGNSTIEVTSVTVDVSDTGSKSCINLQNIDNNVIPSEFRDHLLFKNSSGSVLNYEEQGQGLEVETGTNYEGIVTIYYSLNIIGEQSSLVGCNPHSDPIGIIKTYEEISEGKLSSLADLYSLDYEGLKAELGIPEGTEFNFYILDSLRNIVITAKSQEVPSNTNIFVEETPIQYLGEDGEIIFGFLKIEVW